MVETSNCLQTKHGPMVIVRNLPNGTPGISAFHDVNGMCNYCDIYECHEVLLKNSNKYEIDIHDMFSYCLSICTGDIQTAPNTTSMLKHCCISFEKDLNKMKKLTRCKDGKVQQKTNEDDDCI